MSNYFVQEFDLSRRKNADWIIWHLRYHFQAILVHVVLKVKFLSLFVSSMEDSFILNLCYLKFKDFMSWVQKFKEWRKFSFFMICKLQVKGISRLLKFIQVVFHVPFMREIIQVNYLELKLQHSSKISNTFHTLFFKKFSHELFKIQETKFLSKFWCLQFGFVKSLSSNTTSWFAKQNSRNFILHHHFSCYKKFPSLLEFILTYFKLHKHGSYHLLHIFNTIQHCSYHKKEEEMVDVSTWH